MLGGMVAEFVFCFFLFFFHLQAMLGGMVAEFGAAGALKQKKKRGKKPSDIANPEEAPVYIFFQLFYFCLNFKEFFSSCFVCR